MQDINGDTPLHLLAQCGDVKSVRWILNRVDSVYIRNYVGLMPVQMTRS
jgi:serine/threonine protein kinase